MMRKTVINQKKAAKKFIKNWAGHGYEKGETQKFWIDLLTTVFGIENISQFIFFEEQVKDKIKNRTITNFIDAYIPETRVMIEQKSSHKDLREPVRQSDGTLLTPFQQAKKYVADLPLSQHPKWIVTCNFDEFLVYDMENPNGEPQQIFLKDLETDFYRLYFLVDRRNDTIKREEEVSLKAGELVGKLYDALFKEYIEPDENSLRSLNILCVRIVFCLYAEDAGLFETRTAFEDYIKSFSLENLRHGIQDLFRILNTKPENRDKYDTKINLFPYTNGGLFADDTIEIPNFTKEIVDVIVNHCAPFDWSKISPTIFGAVFESTLNPETRRKGGMHYTSIENIHKVIDPLFLDDLKAEFAKIVKTCRGASLKIKLDQFRNKLALLTFLDPACGSGNFLTETYISLRRLENECLKVVNGSQMLLSSDDFSPIKVKISQFYGIEINDFAVTVAKTALWIAESQMMKETEEIVEQNLDFLPLSTSATIVEGNALRMDWRYLHEEAEIPTITAKKTNLIYPFMVRESEPEYRASDTFSDKEHGFKYDEINLITNEINVGKTQHKQEANHYDYIMGNPPFVGTKYQSPAQKQDIISLCADLKPLDYVTGWYKKAADFIQNSKTRCAFVSTNSITQGEQVAPLWKVLNNIQIDFAYRTFRWDSESAEKAAVHCVIIGFSCKSEKSEKSQKRIYLEKDEFIEAGNINGYLLDAPDVYIEARRNPICEVAPKMSKGSQPTDGGNFLMTQEEKNLLLKKSPQFEPYVKRYMGADDLINNRVRWCLWLKDCPPNILRSSSEVMRRIEKVKKSRLESSKEATRKQAEIPTLFTEDRQPERDFIILPVVSSERRRYMPMCYVSKDVIANANAQMIPEGDLYTFGILNSNIHNAWMRAVCGRMKSDYAYSATIVYNNFPWPDVLSAGRKMHASRVRSDIEQTAQAILDARAKYPDSSLADLYDETTMPPDLRKAHKANDLAVMQAYGFNPKITESEIVAELFKMYSNLLQTL